MNGQPPCTQRIELAVRRADTVLVRRVIDCPNASAGLWLEFADGGRTVNLGWAPGSSQQHGDYLLLASSLSAGATDGQDLRPLPLSDPLPDVSDPSISRRPDESGFSGEMGELYAEPLPVVPNYKVCSALGAGSMGVVYRAEQLDLKREVALKVLRRDAGPHSRQRARFRREARLTASLRDPGIAAVYDAGLLGSHAYCAMELIDGPSFADILRRGLMPLDETLDLMINVARTVHRAHTAGVLHRDIKPSNLMVRRSGQPVVVDFGLARSLNRSDLESLQTRHGTAVGTLGYMSPEQATGDEPRVGPHSDVFSLGVVLYQCLSNRLPFDGEGGARRSDTNAVLAPLPQQNLPAALYDVLRRALAPAVEDRYSTAHEFAEDLERLRTGRAPAARRTASTRRRHRRGALVAALATFVLAAAIVGTTASIGPSRHDSAPSQSHQAGGLALRPLDAARASLRSGDLAEASSILASIQINDETWEGRHMAALMRPWVWSQSLDFRPVGAAVDARRRTVRAWTSTGDATELRILDGSRDIEPLDTTDLYPPHATRSAAWQPETPGRVTTYAFGSPRELDLPDAFVQPLRSLTQTAGAVAAVDGERHLWLYREGADEWLRLARFERDPKLLAFAREGELLIENASEPNALTGWHVAAAALAYRQPLATSDVLASHVADAGHAVVLVGPNDLVHVHDAETGERRGIVQIPSALDSAFDVDLARGWLFAGLPSGLVQLLCIDTGQSLASHAGHQVRVRQVKSSHRLSMAVSIDGDENAIGWQPAAGPEFNHVAPYPRSVLHRVDVSPNGQWIAAIDARLDVYVLDARTWTWQRCNAAPENASMVCWLTDERLLAVSVDGAAHVVNQASGQLDELWALPPAADFLAAIEDAIIVGTPAGIQRFDLENRRRVWSIDRAKPPFAVDADSGVVAATTQDPAGQPALILLDAGTGVIKASFDLAARRQPVAVAIKSDTVAVADDHGGLLIIDASSAVRATRSRPARGENGTMSLAFVDEAARLIVAGRQVQLYDTTTATPLLRLDPPAPDTAQEFFDVATTRNGALVVAGSRSGLHVWRAPVGEATAMARRKP